MESAWSKSNFHENLKVNLLSCFFISEDGPFIILVPSEDAFKNYTPEQLKRLSKGQVLKYHIIPLRGQSGSLSSLNGKVGSLQRRNLKIIKAFNRTFVNNALVISDPFEFPQGVIQVNFSKIINY